MPIGFEAPEILRCERCLKKWVMLDEPLEAKVAADLAGDKEKANPTRTKNVTGAPNIGQGG